MSSMKTLSSTEIHYLMQRFPQFELSYETIPHKKVSNKYNVCIAIPVGVKCFVWFSYYGEDDVCFIMELNKDKKIAKVSYRTYTVVNIRRTLAIQTLFYGTFIESTGAFVIEDVFYYKGVTMEGSYFGDKLGFLENMYVRDKISDEIGIAFYLPAMWTVEKEGDYECLYDIPKKYAEKYPIHHIQYRCLTGIAPYLNVYPLKKGFAQISSNSVPDCLTEIFIPYRGDPTKSQYRMTTIFKVMADLQFDVYHLFAYGRNKSSVYYNVAYIPNYKTSVFMNNLFRKIKENRNLDSIEESDDEEDFQNMEIDKYVDLKKYVFMECRYSPKFKKWVPLKVVQPNQKVVHISSL